MKSNASLFYNCFLVIGDFLSLLLAFGTAYILRVSLDHYRIAVHIHAVTYITAFLVLLPFWIIFFALIGLYNNSIYEKRYAEVGRLAIGSLFGILFIIGYSYAFNKAIFPAHLVALYGLILAFVILVIFRNLARSIRRMLFSYNYGVTNVLLVGNTEITHDLLSELHDYRTSGYRVIGIVGPAAHKHEGVADVPIFRTFRDSIESLGTGAINSIVQTELYANEDKNKEILEFSQTNHVSYRFTPGNSELFSGNLEVELFRSAVPVITVHQTQLFGWGRVVKRAFDLFVGTILLIIALPFMLVIAFLIVLFGGRGPIYFKQTRLTRFDHKFNALKFRTMKREYSSMIPEAGFKKMGRMDLFKEFTDNGNYLPDDPRITKLGHLLRAASLDELPQLINVVKGDISLVGPRALIPEDLKEYGKRYAILSVRSGLTGLAQVSGRNKISFEERRQLDIFYVQNWSFWLDLTILLKTLRVIFKKAV